MQYIEYEQSMKQSPLMAKNFRDLLEGKVSKKEVEDLRKFLKSIESG